MGPPRYRYALVNVDKMRIIAVEGEVLLGKCLRCGKCCRAMGCPHVFNETLNYKDHWVCRVYLDRPTRCALWPQPQDQRPEGCGYHYEEQVE